MPFAALVRNKEIVRAFHRCSVEKNVQSVRSYLHPGFVVSTPEYLPWGGTFTGAEHYLNVTLPQVERLLDFQRFSYRSVTAEENRVIAAIHVGVANTSAAIEILEHWTIDNETATSIWVAYFEPAVLIRAVGRAY